MGKLGKPMENNENVGKTMQRYCKKNMQTVTLTTNLREAEHRFSCLNAANSIHNLEKNPAKH